MFSPNEEVKFSPQKRKRSGEFLTCPQCGKDFYLPRSRYDRGERYCSLQCGKAARRVSKVCPVCGKAFEVSISTADRYTVCSWECRKRSLHYVICERCGRTFETSETRYERHFCSENCRRPPNIIICLSCGKPFRTVPSNTYRRFCSFACYRSFVGETLLEQRMRETLDDLRISYVQEASVGRYSVDFLLPDLRVALEVDGLYWHQDAIRDARKTKYLESYGWKVCRISDFDMAETNQLDRLLLKRLSML